MKISIVSPEQVQYDELKVLKQALDLVQKQIRSNQRYATKLRNLINKIENLQRKYSVQI